MTTNEQLYVEDVYGGEVPEYLAQAAKLLVGASRLLTEGIYHWDFFETSSDGAEVAVALISTQSEPALHENYKVICEKINERRQAPQPTEYSVMPTPTERKKHLAQVARADAREILETKHWNSAYNLL